MIALYLIGVGGGAVSFAVGLGFLAVPFGLLALGAYAVAHERGLASRH